MKADLGLMDFSDQIELGARLAEDQPEVGVAEREKFKVVLLDEYQDTSVAQATMLVPAFGGGHAGHGGRRPQPGDLRLARRLGLQHPRLRRDVPRRATARCRRTRSPSTAAPTAASSTVANRLAAPLYAATTPSRPLEPKPEARRGRRHHAGLRDPARGAGLAGRRRCARPTAARDQRWSDIGVLTRDNAHAAEVFDALTEAGIPVEIVGLSGLLRLPEVAEVVAVLHLLKDVTVQRLAAHAAHRPALGDRAARPQAARRPRPRAGRRSWPRLERPDVHRRPPGRDRRRHRPGRDPVPRRRAQRPGRGDLLRRGARAVRPARRRAADAALARRGAAPRHRAPDHRHDRRRRRARVGGQPGRRRTARQPRPVRPGRGRLPGGRRRRHPRRAPRLPHRRGGGEQGPRGRGSVRRRLGQAADRPPRQGAGVVGGVPRRRLRRAVPELRSRGRCGPPRRPCCRRRCAATPPTCPSCAATTRRPSTPTAPTPGRTRRTEELRLGYVAVTRAAHPSRSPRSAGARGSRRSDLRTTRCRCATSSRSGARPSSSGSTRPPRATPTPTPPRTRRGRGRRRGSSAEAERRLDGGRAGARRRPRLRGRRPRHGRGRPGRRLGRRGRAAARRGARRPQRRDRRAAARLRCRRPPCSGCGTDPEAFARELARPMPRPPSRAARFGTLFHAWVEARFGQQPLLDPDDLPGRADPGIDDEADLDTVIAAFESGPFADRVPHAVEAPFALVLAGQVVRGRIDAVYDEPGREAFLRRRLEDQPPRGRRPAPARALPAGLGRAPRRASREGARRVPLRPDRHDRRARRPAGPRLEAASGVPMRLRR